jgi:tRNA dimethylallyltransferase
MASPGPNVLRSLLVLVGPTACGKTALALELAERCPLEVVSADSRTVYRGMDLGTAKPSPAERQRVAHHLIDVVDPDEPYSLATYQQQALAAIADIQARGRRAALVGGAGLYVSAVCDGLLLPDVPPNVEFRSALEARGRVALLAELAQVDPESARRIDPRNVRRMIRALEVHHATGVPFSAWQSRRFALPFAPVLIGLEVERQELYRRIDARIDAWVAGGFIDEVRGLLDAGYAPSLPSMSSLGYREIARFLGGELALEDAVAQFKQATHQYAKRQLTWFRRDTRIRWLSAPSADEVLALSSAMTASDR